MTGNSPSDYLVSYLGHSLGGYPSAEMQSVYSIAPADWAIWCEYKETPTPENQDGHINLHGLFNVKAILVEEQYY